MAFLIERGASKETPRVSAPPQSPQVKASLGALATVLARVPPASAPVQEMERAIRQSRFTIAVISSRYLESGNTEEEAIITKVMDMGDRKRRLIPVVIEAVPLPVWLYGIVGIDWTKRDPLVDPFDKLKATLGAPGTPL